MGRNCLSNNKTKFSFSVVSICTALIFILTSCKQSETDQMREAQLCLNSAPAGQASNCLSKISNNTSEQAYELRCSASFIDGGLGDPIAVLNALNEANGTSQCSGCSSSLNTLNVLAFDTLTLANETFNNCKLSGVSSYTQVSSIVKVATLAKSVSTTATTAEEFQTVLASLAGADEETLGQIAIDTVTYGCAQSTSSSNTSALQQYCTELSNTVISSSAADVGACLKYHLTGLNPPGGSCPSL